MNPARSHRIAQMWTSGRYTQVEIADALGISQGTVNNELKSAGLRRHPAARALRPKRVGRPKVWPDCPGHMLEDYRTLRSAGFRAAEARAMLEGQCRA